MPKHSAVTEKPKIFVVRCKHLVDDVIVEKHEVIEGDNVVFVLIHKNVTEGNKNIASVSVIFNHYSVQVDNVRTVSVNVELVSIGNFSTFYYLESYITKLRFATKKRV